MSGDNVVSLLCTASKLSMSILNLDAQIEFPYSKIGLTNVH